MAAFESSWESGGAGDRQTCAAMPPLTGTGKGTEGLAAQRLLGQALPEITF